jgi:hypothetical protein
LSGHVKTQRALAGLLRRGLVNDATAVHHENAIAEGEDLGQLRRNEQDRAPGIARLDQSAVNEIGGAEIHAARRVGDQHDG